MDDAIFKRHISDYAAIFWGAPDFANLLLCELGEGRASYAVSAFVCLILLMCGPSQVFSMGIAAIAIPMGHLMHGTWGRAMERFADKAMDQASHNLLVVPKDNGRVTVHNVGTNKFTSSGARACNMSHDRAVTKNNILWRVLDYTRVFHAIEFFSHAVSPHVCGQGRALLTQRFRPVLLIRSAYVCQYSGGVA